MPSATAREFQKVAQALGFYKTRQTGSHERWNHADGRAVTIPVHAGHEVGPLLFFKILRQFGRHVGGISEAPVTCQGRGRQLYLASEIAAESRACHKFIPKLQRMLTQVSGPVETT